MSEIWIKELLTLERVTALLCLGHIGISILHAIESMKTAHILGEKWEYTISFTAIAAFILSVTVVVRWALLT